MRSRELEKTLRKLNNTDETVAKAIDALTKTITNKLVHSHIALIKENSDVALLDIYRRYFHFEEQDEKNDEKNMDNRNQR
jgi:glutamyl-tRNA reductase